MFTQISFTETTRGVSVQEKINCLSHSDILNDEVVNQFSLFWKTDYSTTLDALNDITKMYSLHNSIRQTSTVLLYSGTTKTNPTPVVLKFVTNKQASKCELSILDEYLLITGRNHIVNCLDYFELQNVNCDLFVLEYLNKDLFEPTTTLELVKYINDIADAIKTIHTNVIIYADMKPEHILYNKQTKTATLIDFGLCIDSRANQEVKGIYGTLPYMAPEVLQLQTFTNKIDIWGFGLSLIETLLLKPLFIEKTTLEELLLAQQAFIDRIDQVKTEIDVKYPNIMTDCLWDLIKRMLSWDPTIRPTSREIFSFTKKMLK